MTRIIRDIQKYSEWVSAHAGRLPAVHLRLFDCPCRSSSRPLPNMPPGGRFLHLLRRVVHADQSSQPGHMLLGHPHPGSSAKDCRVGRRNLHGMPHGRRSSASMINRNMAWGKAPMRLRLTRRDENRGQAEASTRKQRLGRRSLAPIFEKGAGCRHPASAGG